MTVFEESLVGVACMHIFLDYTKDKKKVVLRARRGKQLRRMV